MTREEFLDAVNKAVESYGGAYFQNYEKEEGKEDLLYLESYFSLDELEKVVALWKEYREHPSE